MSTYLYDEGFLKKLNNWTEKADVHVYGVDETRSLFEIIADENNDDDIKLPIITLRRNRGYIIRDGGTSKRPLSYEGQTETETDFNTYQLALDFCNEKGLNSDIIKPKSYCIHTNRFETYEDAKVYCDSINAPYDIIHTPTYEKYYIDNIDLQPETAKVVKVIPISILYQIDIYTRYELEADLLMRNLIFNIVNYPTFKVKVPKTELKHTASLTLNDTIEDNSDIPERFVKGNLTRLTAIVSIDDANLFDVRELHNVDIDIRIDDTYESEYSIYER